MGIGVRASRGERGVTLVESAIALPFLLVLLILSFELLKVSYYQLTLQFALTRVARNHSVNQSLDFRSSLDTLLDGFGVGLTAADMVTVCPRSAALCAPNVVDAGQPLDRMTYQVDRGVNVLFLPNSISKRFGSAVERTDFALTAIVLGRNEPA